MSKYTEQEKEQVKQYFFENELVNGIDQLISSFPNIDAENLLDILDTLEKEGIIEIG